MFQGGEFPHVPLSHSAVLRLSYGLLQVHEPFTRVYEGALRKEPADNFSHWRMLF